MLPEILKEKKEIKVYEELQKGSEKLRQEATLNLQKFGGNYMPDFYGGKARMLFRDKDNIVIWIIYILF